MLANENRPQNSRDAAASAEHSAADDATSAVQIHGAHFHSAQGHFDATEDDALSAHTQNLHGSESPEDTGPDAQQAGSGHHADTASDNPHSNAHEPEKLSVSNPRFSTDRTDPDNLCVQDTLLPPGVLRVSDAAKTHAAPPRLSTPAPPDTGHRTTYEEAAPLQQDWLGAPQPAPPAGRAVTPRVNESQARLWRSQSQDLSHLSQYAHNAQPLTQQLSTGVTPTEPEAPVLSPGQRKHKLLQHPALWRADQLLQQDQPSVASGFADLDQHLPNGGWPTAGLMECLVDFVGSGELRLLLPGLCNLTQTDTRRWLWINPPFDPYPPALKAAGINLERILVVRLAQQKDALWALEYACRSSACSAVFAWLDDTQLKLRHTQRLQVAAQTGRTLVCLFRPGTARSQASMAQLRVAIRPTAIAHQTSPVYVDILKRRGGWPVGSIGCDIAAATQTEHIHWQHMLKHVETWRAHRQQFTTNDLKPGEPVH